MARQRRKKEFKWVGHQELSSIETHASTAVGDVIELVPCLDDPEAIGDWVIEHVHVWLSLSRTGTGAMQAMAGILAVQATDVARVVTEVLNPLNTTAVQEARMLANKAILLYAHLGIPPVDINDAQTSRVQRREVVVTHLEFKGRRRIHLQREALTWTAVGDITDTMIQFVTGRTLLSRG